MKVFTRMRDMKKNVTLRFIKEHTEEAFKQLEQTIGEEYEVVLEGKSYIMRVEEVRLATGIDNSFLTDNFLIS